MTATNPFWTFSLAFYARPGVSPVCLALQEQLGVDVNLLLFCLWRAAEGESLAPGSLRELDSAVADWRSDVVMPIRALRQGLRAHPGVDSTREKLKQAELESERVQQQRMYEWQLQRQASAHPGGESALAVNLDHYAALLGVEPEALAGVEELARHAGIGVD